MCPVVCEEGPCLWALAYCTVTVSQFDAERGHFQDGVISELAVGGICDVEGSPGRPWGEHCIRRGCRVALILLCFRTCNSM